MIEATLMAAGSKGIKPYIAIGFEEGKVRVYSIEDGSVIFDYPNDFPGSSADAGTGTASKALPVFTPDGKSLSIVTYHQTQGDSLLEVIDLGSESVSTSHILTGSGVPRAIYYDNAQNYFMLVTQSYGTRVYDAVSHSLLFNSQDVVSGGNTQGLLAPSGDFILFRPSVYMQTDTIYRYNTSDWSQAYSVTLPDGGESLNLFCIKWDSSEFLVYNRSASGIHRYRASDGAITTTLSPAPFGSMTNGFYSYSGDYIYLCGTGDVGKFTNTLDLISSTSPPNPPIYDISVDVNDELLVTSTGYDIPIDSFVYTFTVRYEPPAGLTFNAADEITINGRVG